MKRMELDFLKRSAREKREKASDLDVLVQEMGKLPPGQLKKLMTAEVLAVLEKYGYGQ